MSLFAAASYRASNSPESPLSTPSQWFIDLFSGGQSDAGENVNEKTALKYSAVWNAVSILSSAISTIPCKVYQRDASGNKTERPDHPAAALVGSMPNELMTGNIFKQTGMSHDLLNGNFYAAITRDGRGNPGELILLQPHLTEIRKLSDRFVYFTVLEDGTSVKIEISDMVHVPGLSSDGLTGLSVIGHAKNAIGLGLATEKFGSKFFKNGANLGGVIEHPGTFKDKQTKKDFAKSWKETYAGGNNSLKTAILEMGMKYTPIGIPPEDAQFLETRKFGVTEVARWFNLPPHMIKDLDRSTNNNIEQQAIEFVVHSLRPWLVKWEEEFERKLLTNQQRRSGRWGIKFNVNALLRGSSEAQSRFIDTMIKNGVYSINDGRRFLDQNTVDGGDRHFIQRDKMPLDRYDEFVDKTIEDKAANEPQRNLIKK